MNTTYSRSRAKLRRRSRQLNCHAHNQFLGYFVQWRFIASNALFRPGETQPFANESFSREIDPCVFEREQLLRCQLGRIISAPKLIRSGSLLIAGKL